MDADVLAQEGGANAAALLLRHYNRDRRTWNLAKDSEIWQAVHAAHRLGRLGAGRRVAVIDSAFDMDLPALAGHTIVGSAPSERQSAHGTAAALLILEVAPDVELLLMPASVAGKLSLDLVVAGIRAAVESKVDIINLSLGLRYKTSGIWRKTPLDSGVESDDWRHLFEVPSSPIGEAVEAALGDGIMVVAASGNSRDHVFSPAAVPGVIAVGFHAVQRKIGPDGMEEAASVAPSFSQSIGADCLLVQPAHVLGSSFASPLIAGFAAVMSQRHELSSFIASARRAATASQFMTELGETDETIALFRGAIAAVPHEHKARLPWGCPECALFAAPAFVNLGLCRLNRGELRDAVELLSTARNFAPGNEHAAANLGVTAAVWAEIALARGSPGVARRALLAAVDCFSRAVELRPNHRPYQRRLAEFRAAVASPQDWKMRR